MKKYIFWLSLDEKFIGTEEEFTLAYPDRKWVSRVNLN
jgi:hypothetical protein